VDQDDQIRDLAAIAEESACLARQEGVRGEPRRRDPRVKQARDPFEGVAPIIWELYI
jgi:hypothetical protein